MSTDIHPTAIVEPGAELDEGVYIGPYCRVSSQARIGKETRLISHVVIQNQTTLGAHNTVHPFACLGGEPQDLKFSGENTRLLIGDHNTFREGVTANIGTAQDEGVTRIGNQCFFMAYSHVAHDCMLADQVIVANGVGLAGHVHIDHHATLGGLAGVHQHCKIGAYAFIGGGAMVAQDVPPYCVAQGDRARLMGLNLVGLKRQGWNRTQIANMRAAFKALFQSDAPIAKAAVQLESTQPHSTVLEIIAFIKSSKRGICAPQHIHAVTEPE